MRRQYTGFPICSKSLMENMVNFQEPTIISVINNTSELFTFSTSSGEKGTPGGCSNCVTIAPKERQTMNEPLSI